MIALGIPAERVVFRRKGAAKPCGTTKDFAGSRRAVTDRVSEGGVVDTAQRVQVQASSGGSKNQGTRVLDQQVTWWPAWGYVWIVQGCSVFPGHPPSPPPCRLRNLSFFLFRHPLLHFPTTTLCWQQHWCETQNLLKLS